MEGVTALGKAGTVPTIPTKPGVFRDVLVVSPSPASGTDSDTQRSSLLASARHPPLVPPEQQTDRFTGSEGNPEKPRADDVPAPVTPPLTNLDPTDPTKTQLRAPTEGPSGVPDEDDLFCKCGTLYCNKGCSEGILTFDNATPPESATGTVAMVAGLARRRPVDLGPCLQHHHP